MSKLASPKIGDSDIKTNWNFASSARCWKCKDGVPHGMNNHYSIVKDFDYQDSEAKKKSFWHPNPEHCPYCSKSVMHTPSQHMAQVDYYKKDNFTFPLPVQCNQCGGNIKDGSCLVCGESDTSSGQNGKILASSTTSDGAVVSEIRPFTHQDHAEARERELLAKLATIDDADVYANLGHDAPAKATPHVSKQGYPHVHKYSKFATMKEAISSPSSSVHTLTFDPTPEQIQATKEELKQKFKEAVENYPGGTGYYGQ